MAELQIIGASQSNFVWVTRIVCTEKGVPYTLIPARPHTPEVDAIHPFGKIPVMRHGDVSLCESRAISAYVDRVFEGPSLMPRDPVLAAQTEQWVAMLCTTIDPLWFRRYLAAYVFPGTPDGLPDRTRIDAALPLMAPQFEIMERAVARGHLAGDSFTLADAYFIPILFYMNSKPESGALLAKSPNLKHYFERHFARPSIQATKPDSVPGAPNR